MGSHLANAKLDFRVTSSTPTPMAAISWRASRLCARTVLLSVVLDQKTPLPLSSLDYLQPLSSFLVAMLTTSRPSWTVPRSTLSLKNSLVTHLPSMNEMPLDRDLCCYGCFSKK